MTHAPTRLALAGALLWAALASPWLESLLTATMTRQMLAQVPLLALAGWLGAQALPPRFARVTAPWDRAGITGMLLVSFTMLLWMLPRVLDAAVADPWAAAAKFASVPLCIGAPLALSWPRAGFVTRGVVLLEAIASAFRFGWVYLATPERLCNAYLLGDQQRLGRALILVGAGLALWLALWALCGAGRADRARA